MPEVLGWLVSPERELKELAHGEGVALAYVIQRVLTVHRHGDGQPPVGIVAAEFAEDFPGARKARDGYTLAALDVIIASDRAKDVTFRPKYATLVGADGEEHAARASGRDPALEEVEDLPKGQTRRGWLTYEVPKNARKFQFRYSLPPAMNDAELRFDLEK